MVRRTALLVLLAPAACTLTLSDDFPAELELPPPDPCADSDCTASQQCNLHDGGCETPVNGVFVTVPGGTFTMGSPPAERGRQGNETGHVVTLTHAFEILATEVTQGELQARMGYAPSTAADCGLACAVETVSWHEAAAYCNALSLAATPALSSCYTCTGDGPAVTCSVATGIASIYDCPGYRLPTEAEWERAARAGTSSATPGGELSDPTLACDTLEPSLDGAAWYCANATGPRAVGGTEGNAYGLYDMLGNVAEWCHDGWSADLGSAPSTDPETAATDTAGALVDDRVRRGGAWHDDGTWVRAAQRAPATAAARSSGLGFRPVRTVPP